jgi:TolB protein
MTVPFPGLVRKKGVMNSGGKFAPDAKLVVYTQITEGLNGKRGSSNISLIVPPGFAEKSGKRKELITGDGIDVDPIFSPDGKWLAYVSGRYGNPHIFRSELRWDADLTDITIKSELRLTFAGWWNAMPAWSPDSQKIAFAGFDKDINRFDIFLMNNDGTKLERLTLQSGDNKSPSFSPNGQMVIFHSSRIGTASDRGRNQLYMMNQDGTEQRMISTGLYDAEDPKWGPYMRKD